MPHGLGIGEVEICELGHCWGLQPLTVWTVKSQAQIGPDDSGLLSQLLWRQRQEARTF